MSDFRRYPYYIGIGPPRLYFYFSSTSARLVVSHSLYPASANTEQPLQIHNNSMKSNVRRRTNFGSIQLWNRLVQIQLGRSPYLVTSNNWIAWVVATGHTDYLPQIQVGSKRSRHTILVHSLKGLFKRNIHAVITLLKSEVRRPFGREFDNATSWPGWLPSMPMFKLALIKAQYGWSNNRSYFPNMRLRGCPKLSWLEKNWMRFIDCKILCTLS